MAIVTVDGQRVFELNVIKRAEKRITQREVISLPEKINAPATVQILLNRNLPVD